MRNETVRARCDADDDLSHSCLPLSLAAAVVCARDPLAYRSRLQEFDAISEWIRDVHTQVAFQRIILDYLQVVCFELRHEAFEVRNEQRGVCLAGRTEAHLHTKMDFEVTTLKPSASTSGERRGLRDFGDAEKSLIELAGALFHAGWHGELHVFDGEYRHVSVAAEEGA